MLSYFPFSFSPTAFRLQPRTAAKFKFDHTPALSEQAAGRRNARNQPKDTDGPMSQMGQKLRFDRPVNPYRVGDNRYRPCAQEAEQCKADSDLSLGRNFHRIPPQVSYPRGGNLGM